MNVSMCGSPDFVPSSIFYYISSDDRSWRSCKKFVFSLSQFYRRHRKNFNYYEYYFILDDEALIIVYMLLLSVYIYKSVAGAAVPLVQRNNNNNVTTTIAVTSDSNVTDFLLGKINYTPQHDDFSFLSPPLSLSSSLSTHFHPP